MSRPGPIPADPEIRNLRSRIGAARRDGRTDDEAEARRRLSVVKAERELTRALHDLNVDDRTRFVTLVVSGGVTR